MCWEGRVSCGDAIFAPESDSQDKAGSDDSLGADG
jgi:hypothetical protein